MVAHILIVDDEPSIRDLVSVNLTRAGHSVDSACDAHDARAAMLRRQPDLIILDWMLPGMSGLELTRVLRADPLTRDLPIILLSARSDERDRVAGLEVGADDYITKPFSVRELIARVGVVLRRRAPQASAEAVRLAGLIVDPSAKTVIVDGVPVSLGATEFRLLHFLVTHADRVYTRAQLLDFVWGADFDGDERTVDVYVSRLRSALAASGKHRLIRTVRGSGYCLAVVDTSL